MRKTNLLKLMFAIFASLAFIACSGGGGGGGGGGVADSDQDGIPNTEDAFPNDATQFAALTETALAAFAPGTTFSTAVAVNNSGQVIGSSNNGTDDS